ncbi:MAG: SMP-30/gluconolactonase/LRE family protein [Allorhizobium sp.]
MNTIHPFAGTVLSGAALHLGEGPSYDPATDTLWWFDILGMALHEHDLAGGGKRVHSLPVMASVIAAIDAQRQLLATEQGLFLRDTTTGELSPHLAFETDRPTNRSNDGRVHPSGALWIGTMGKSAEAGAGTIYHIAGTTVTPLFTALTIPNAICFSPDGATGYFTDTRVNRLMAVDLDPQTGLPTAPARVLVDGSGQPGGIDGAICDADGTIWNARWGEGAVDRYDDRGQHLARYLVPARQTTCPAFIGRDADRIAVTSAAEGLSAEDRLADPQAGSTFDLGITVKGRHEPAFRL